MNILGVIHQVVVSEKEYLYKKGDCSDEFYIIYNGSIRLLNDDYQSFVKFGKGTYFGEIEMFQNTNRKYTAYVEEESTLGIITKADFWKTIKDFKTVLDEYVDVAIKRAHSFEEIAS
jgi:CRP-like cAMP-binding protein